MKAKIFFLVLMSMGFASCEKYLDVPPETSLSSTTFFQKEADFQQAVNAAYVPLRSIFNNHNWVLAELHSDNTYYARNVAFGNEEQTQNVADFNIPTNQGITTNTRVRDLYRLYYQVIARSNQILATIDEVEFDADSKNNLKGQALYLRAFSYFDLVRFFGSVPIHLEPVIDRAGAALPLATTEELYIQIENDAKEAANLLKPKSTQEPGRATSGSAKTVLTNLYIEQKRWKDAEDMAKSIIDSGEYSLIPEYENVFSTSTGNKNNSESIFEIQYMEGSAGYQSNFIYAFIPRPILASEVATIFGPTQNQQGISVEGKNIPTPDLIAAYEPDDERKDASIGYVTLSGSLWAPKTYPYTKKYAKPHALDNNTGINWPVYRYAEVCLFYAEALNEQNKPGDAATYLDKVRNRAGLGNTTATSQADMREAIFKERRVELAFENKRWHDIRRTDRIQEIIAPHGQKIKSNPFNYYFPEGYEPPSDAFTNLDPYYGLPADESALTPNF
ncbi:RagB/SusD family nutrient uptake outer membrane protein [Agriterribacter sp.]|uniref:RagB/SusD family nutrient uptake outer membrane protein n=1 Tax=Agriterribacter sp. TaxID=2821509 RepID=UPI002B7F1E78|nr:RagB/SusD family nutrient uptake outer membrane protein [Agriterribacter sp.]HRO47279.1 RagB/SusD family nutrient uptake outer membrane protein [Agriterribacter sp.]HRQ16557.1 RagB/SusD family nutrient uptake outer membrane protein [Agriterribacter sp.]